MELVPDSIGIFHKSKWIRWKWDGSQLGDWDNLICKKKKNKKKIIIFFMAGKVSRQLKYVHRQLTLICYSKITIFQAIFHLPINRT